MTAPRDPGAGGSGGDPVAGRERCAAVLRAALRAGRHVLLEGPSGAGKTLLLRHVCRDRAVVEVNATTVFSSGGLVGRADPGRALAARSRPRPVRAGRAAFLPGPLVEAMRAGAVLVLDEANRLSPDAFAVLVPAMSEGELVVPGLGTVRAAAGFHVLAVANPQDRIGTGAVPAAFLDRAVRISIGHPGDADARRIVAARVPGVPPRLVARAVAVVRASRSHPEVAVGASVRGAIDLCAVASALAAMGGDPGRAPADDDQRRAARLALSARLHLAAHVGRPVEAVIDELWDDVLLGERRARPGTGHRLPPSVLTTGEETEGPVAAGAEPLDAPGGAATGPDAAVPAGGPTGSAAAGGGAGAGSGPGGGPGEEQAPEMVLRETEAALAAFVAQGAAPGEVVALGAAPGPHEVRRLAEVASRVVVRKLAGARTVRAAGSRMAAVRYSFRSDDLDLDRTVEELVANPLPSWSDIWVRDRVPRRRGVALILDVSGSMRGEPLLHAATAAGAATLALAGSDDLAVVAFWRSSAVLLAPGDPAGALAVVSRVLALRPWGLTDIAGGLARAAQLLDRMPTPHRQALVMTDGRANAGADPVAVAARFARLDVLATDGSPATVQRCRALASAGHGSCRSYDGLDELPLRLSELLSG